MRAVPAFVPPIRVARCTGRGRIDPERRSGPVDVTPYSPQWVSQRLLDQQSEALQLAADIISLQSDELIRLRREQVGLILDFKKAG